MGESRKGHVVAKLMKILGWTLLGVVVLLSVLLFCVMNFIDSKRFPPLVENVVNQHIDGKLKIGGLKLAFQPRFPILSVEVENLSVTSDAFKSLTSEQRGLLPVYADSLLSLDYMAGSLDIKRLMMDNELILHDVVLRGLNVNLVIAHNGLANYEVLKIPTDSADSPKSKLPKFRINRFALDQPKEIRFYNAADSTSASVLLLTDASVDGDRQPTYRLKINGNVTSPKATLITNLDQIDFGLNGKVLWDPDHPGLVAMDEMEIRGAFLKAVIKGEIDLENNPVIRKAVVDLSPVSLADILSVIPDSIRRHHRLYQPYFSTDLSIEGRVELLKPMDLTTDTVPTARINLSVPPSALHYGKARFEELALDATVSTFTNCLDSTLVDINRCVVAGVDSRLELSAILATLFSDPSFDTDMKGEFDLDNLPPFMREKIPGYLSGIISTDIHLKGRASAVSPNHLHRLVADGSLMARNLYFLSADTNKMVVINKATVGFDSRRIVDDLPLLHAKVEVDTANILVGGVDIAVGSLALTAEVDRVASHADSTRIVPVDGDLNVKRLNIISITDSAGGRIRNLQGKIKLRGFNHPSLLPEFLADLHTGHVSAGSLSDRILLNDADIKATLDKLPSKPHKRSGSGKAAPPHKEYTYISPAEVIGINYEKRRHKPGEKRRRRVYGIMGAEDNEILEWDLAKGFSKFLNEWRLKGSVVSGKARLLTPMFPLHNHFSRIDVRFNNDSVAIDNISVRAGQSDMTISGLVSNVRRALTSKTDNDLKVNLSLLSDTIDINELSAGAFIGASYAQRRRYGKNHILATDDDAALAAHLDALAKKDPGKSAPFLIPVNVKGNLRIEADKLLYSDLTMQNLQGDLLVYDGGVNLHDMKADSDAGSLSVSALYSAPNPEDMHFGFGLELADFNIGKFVRLVPAIDSIMPIIHDFSGTIGAEIAATCRVDSGMNLMLPSLNAAIRINGDNLAFIDPHTYHTLGKWLGFKNKADNTIKKMNVEMTVEDGLLRVYPFAFNIDRYRLGIYGSNDIALNFNYHISVLKSPIPFKFGITISGHPKKYKVRFGGAKFKESTVVESVNVVNDARINLVDQIENVFKRGVQNSRFAKLRVAHPADFESFPDPGLTPSDSLQLVKEGLIHQD